MSQSVLPKEASSDIISRLRDLGVQFNGEYDAYFEKVSLPDGWKIKCIYKDVMYKLVNSNDVVAALIFVDVVSMPSMCVSMKND